MVEVCSFFLKILGCNADFVAVENPIQHGYARKMIGPYSQVIQPYKFGHKEQKATCLWLHNLPPLKTTHDVEEETHRLPESKRQRLHYLSPSPSRSKEGSRTFQVIADAMAEQWTRYILTVLRYRNALVKNS